jgi:uncharacterized membrane protein SpoIIM required for sporulation
VAEPLTAFVARRRPEWEALRQMLDRRRRADLHLEEILSLDRLYRRATGDLARAQAIYPGTDAHRFLNELCGTAYAAIYRPPRAPGHAVRRFFTQDFPASVRRELRFVGVSASLLALGAVLGALLVFSSPAAARWVVPQGVLDAVEDHRMWTDDLVGIAPAATSSAVATNNLTVTVLAFASGITLGVGTAYLLVVNGMLLGAAAVLCARAGMGYALLCFIAGHGPVELSVIAIAGGAGLMIGHAMVDPGELARRTYLKKRSADAVKLVIGCAPFLGLIALIEGFISPGQLFPGWLKIALGVALGTAFWSYLLLAGKGDDARGATAGSASVRLLSRW